MSRIGNKTISIPGGVTASIAEGSITVKGPKGELSSPIPEGVIASLENGELSFQRTSEEGRIRANHGLARALANNSLVGVTEGFKKRLLIKGVGYRVNVNGSTVEMHLGYSHPINFELPKGVTATSDQDKVTKSIGLTLEGSDKQLVGQVAANIRKLRKPEPYKGKGIKYADETILRKAGKSGK